MGGSVKLRIGNLFDGPSDLIVLPCSTAGTITGFVARSLVDYDIPHPRVGMRLGAVDKGIQARLDKFHLRRGMDLPQWMCNELALANRRL